jgi:3'(2'), 5'-bisphosphate nucleotidase
MESQIRQIAEAAGREIMRIYKLTDRGVTSKADQSFVTEADLRANEVILEGLTQLTNEKIVSEEGDLTKAALEVQSGGTRPFWLVDPLDGTKDFVNHLDTFVVCIARVENKQPVFGLIHWPVTGETWWAEKNRGAFGPEGDKLQHPRSRTEYICAGSRSMPKDRNSFYEQFNIKEIQRYGSALKFCRLAEGAIDIYPRLGMTSEWDTAAGQIIAEEAGCHVLSLSTGRPLEYGKERFENRGGFVASRSDLNLVEVLRRARDSRVSAN